MKASLALKAALKKPLFPYEIFHTKTQPDSLLNNNTPMDQWPKEWKTIYYKGYPRLPSFALPNTHLPKKSLQDILINRISERIFSEKKVSLKKLSALLLYAAGQRMGSNHRFYPSAGARYPLELYFISTNTELPNGIYHYYVKTHCLEQLVTFDTFDFDLYFNQEWIKTAGGLFVITSLFKRTIMKYGTRGYRYIVCESGHMGQNINLIASNLSLSSCGIGIFDEKKLNSLLDLDEREESCLYTIAIGNRSETER